jgi:hypothetical protein
LGWADVYFDIQLSSTHLESIEFQRKQRSDTKAGLRINVYFDSEIREFCLYRDFECGNCRFTNF